MSDIEKLQDALAWVDIKLNPLTEGELTVEIFDAEMEKAELYKSNSKGNRIWIWQNND